ncbi:MAG: hypothetical protein K5900_12440 [Butyrivibrio sp.]|nr:hypothetical protein [Butyrivibrio sp.]
MSEIFKGTVLSISTSTCKVAPLDNIDQVSPSITIPDSITDLAKGDTVAYTVFKDYTGLVISKL